MGLPKASSWVIHQNVNKFFQNCKNKFFYLTLLAYICIIQSIQNRQSMTAKIEGGNMIITIPIDQKGEPSSSGKSNNHYVSAKDTEQPTVQINGKKATIALNVYTSAK